ncbi:MAG: ester cyclase [Pseudomonadales bacterium]
MADANKELFEKLIEQGFNEKDKSRFVQFFADDFVSRRPTGELRGLDGAAEIYDTFAGAFPDAKISIDQILAVGEYVVAKTTFAGTHSGPLHPTPASGKKVSIPVIAIYKIDNGKIVSEDIAWDTLGLAQQIGAV